MTRQAEQQAKLSDADAHNLKMSREGRILIPAHLRRRLGMKPDSELVARVEDGRLVLESKSNILRRLQARFAHLAESVSLADELIADRRRDAALDA